jgi:oligopeptide transport system substrate-binding protein
VRASIFAALLALIALTGCSRPPAVFEPTSTSTATSQPQETARPIPPTAIPTPHLPMATPFATPRPQAGIFTDATIGFTITYPIDWNSSTAAVPGTLVQLANKPDTVFLLILRTVRNQDKSLKVDATDTQAQIGDWFGGMNVLKSQAAKTAAGDPTWRSEYRPKPPNGTVSSLMISVANGPQLITMIAYGTEQDLAPERKTIEQIFGSITISEPQVYGVPRNQAYIYTEQESLSPQAYDPASGPGDRLVFSGLLRFAPDLSLQPDLATGWTLSADGMTYTFFLRRDARFQDGRPVTARDVIYSWERAASPNVRSDTVTSFLGGIVGVQERHSGAAESISGLRTPDDYTLEVTLVAPRPTFLMQLTGGAALVVDQANVQSGAEWYRHPNGSGPYRLIRWEPGQVKIYERNEHYYGTPPVTRYMIAKLDVGYSGIHQYVLGEVDQILLSDTERASISTVDRRLSANVREVPQLCTSFVAFDTSRAPFDDPKVRQAFSLAVDRQRYQERVLRGAGILAHGLYPPALPGYDSSFQGITFDPALARQRLAESRYSGSNALPEITLTTSGDGLSVEPGVGVLVQMWQEQLGARIKIEQLEPTGYAKSMLGDGRGNLFFRTWCADYPDPADVAGALFGSSSPQNLGRYHNTDLDGLLSRAEAESDPSRRIQLYQQAETMIVGDAAAIFLDHRVDTLLVSPQITGLVRAPFALPVEPFIEKTLPVSLP